MAHFLVLNDGFFSGGIRHSAKAALNKTFFDFVQDATSTGSGTSSDSLAPVVSLPRPGQMRNVPWPR